MENMVNPDFWRGKRVFLTGHTGFKGGWLALWLGRMGAQVHGYALPPSTNPSLFDCAQVHRSLASHTLANVCDARALSAAMTQAQPEVVLHLAAQPLVRLSYRDPIDTYATNVMGTVHVLEAVRQTPSVRAVVNVTTDKCYENREWTWGYRESDALGGHDPYASSKACSELVTAAYRASFLAQAGVAVASARAGNVIGGGDWSEDRLLPDLFRAVAAGEPLRVRNPNAVRPWQHVLEPLSGYLMLAERLYANDDQSLQQGWNFGPTDEDALSVGALLDKAVKHLPGSAWTLVGAPDPHAPHESTYLKLDSSKARQILGWRPHWRLDQALQHSAAWFASWRRGDDMHRVCQDQISAWGTECDPR